MGGQAFAKHGIVTPRMPPQAYERLKEAAMKIVSSYYANVVPMPEAPGKLDYGDVDLLVESPHAPSAIQDVAKHLNAKHIIKNGPNYYLAVPLLDADGGTFAQLDIWVCCPDDLDWIRFLHGYGDLGQILGVMNYGFGFTASDKGFHVRIKKLEDQNWKASQVFLTKEPDKLMDFLGLDKQQFAKGFDSEQQLFKWASACKLLNRKMIERRKDDSDNRQRMQKRPMFRRFVSEYLPSLPSTQTTTPATRESLLQEALVYFGKEEEFNARRRIALTEQAEDHAWCLIKSTVLTPRAGLEGKRLNEVIRALQRFVAFRAGRPHICDDPEMDPQRQARFSVMINDDNKVDPLMEDWLLKNWEEVRTLERQRAKNCKESASREG